VNTPRICLIEDDTIMGESLCDRFALEGFRTDWYQRGNDALAALGGSPYDAVISDVRLPDVSGQQILARANSELTLTPPFIFITAYASIEGAVEVLRNGAADYVTKPFDIAELVGKVRTLIGVAPPTADHPPSELGISASMRALAALAQRVGARARTVLITGESGSGKEVLAQYLHRVAAAGSSQPFVAVNCGAIPEALLEASFFGHERGAFTSADRERKGYFEQAVGGTLFLDEIGDLPLIMQVKLMRAIQERRIQRLGAESPIGVDVRVYCATHRDLAGMVRAGSFREDLYYRINVVHLHVPNLRERHEDILWLAQMVLSEQAADTGEHPRMLRADAQAALLAHAWPGNVRELRNRIERACILSEAGALGVPDLFDVPGLGQQGDAATLPTLDSFITDAERSYLAAVLQRADGRVGAAATLLGISRKTLWEKMKRHGLKGRDV
jgi:DNA-binding NtrC family response regulator